MRKKRVKMLKELAAQSGIAYEPLKKVYKRMGQMSPHEERELNKEQQLRSLNLQIDKLSNANTNLPPQP